MSCGGCVDEYLFRRCPPAGAVVTPGPLIGVDRDLDGDAGVQPCGLGGHGGLQRLAVGAGVVLVLQVVEGGFPVRQHVIGGFVCTRTVAPS